MSKQARTTFFLTVEHVEKTLKKNKCPRCDAVMKRIWHPNYGLIGQSCYNCGLWIGFDHGITK